MKTGMTVLTFDAARQRGTAGKIGQLNPMQRYGVAEEVRDATIADTTTCLIPFLGRLRQLLCFWPRTRLHM